jgi:N4-gp56 family major capsid protein
MADVLTQTSSMSPEMQIFYDATFLETADLVRKYDSLAIKKTMPKNGGKMVQFVRTTHFSVVTAALTEGTNPTAVGFSSENVTAEVKEHGFGTKITSLFELTTIDSGLTAKTKELGYHAGLSLDTVLRDVMVAGATAQYAGGKTNITDVNSSDTMSVTELRKVAKTLFDNAAPTWENGMYRGVISSTAQYQLQGDTTVGNWVNVNIYNDGKNAELVKKGVLGRLMGIDLIPTNNSYSSATVGLGASNTGYWELFAGKGAVAEIDIAGQGGNYIIHKKSGNEDTSNPLNMYSTLAWKVNAYAAKVLNSNWIIKVIHQ